MLQSSPLPRAIVCAGDELALGAITAIHEYGLRVPQDIAIIGYNDIPISATTRPSLSTIALPALEIGAQAIRSLLRIMKKEVRAWETHAFSGKLVLRESCGCINKQEVFK
jgi:DNA-binding LacI/PurR family transcriptional regulator